jgi:hypothetical protein
LGRRISGTPFLKVAFTLSACTFVGKLHSSYEGPIRPLGAVVILLLGFLLFLLLSLNDQRVVRQIHLDVVLIETRELGLNY